jgi:uncharacterized SAM-binding protein YcdF (DUF218 family)
MNILLVLLGCNIPYLLNDRVRVATRFANANANDNANNNITWFLSGGIKNPSDETETEAEKMAGQILQYATATSNWNYIYDLEATNTAENFIMVKKHLLETSTRYSNIVVVTSDFHHTRAKKIADQILGGLTSVQWVLSGAELEDSRYWETIHIKNVDADVKKALEKFKM